MSIDTAAPPSATAILTPAQGDFPTRNTDLAACLAAFDIGIKRFERIRDAGSSEAVTHYTFADGNADGTLLSTTYDWAWRHPAEYRRICPGDPFHWMWDAIEAIKWITRVHFGKIAFRPLPFDGEPFTADDWILAACLKASGYRVVRLENKRVSLAVAATDVRLAGLRAEFNGYVARQTPIQWMRTVLYFRSVLIETAKPGGGLRTQTRYRKGKLGTPGGKELLLYETPAPNEDPAEFEVWRAEALRIFHAS